MDTHEIQLRQPLPGDLVGRTLALAGIGLVSEVPWKWRVLADGCQLAGDSFLIGSTGLVTAFAYTSPVETDYVGRATLHLSRAEPADEGLDLYKRSVDVLIIGGMVGYKLHPVVRGETLTSIGRMYGSDASRIAVANTLRDPSDIRVAQLLRIPIFA